MELDIVAPNSEVRTAHVNSYR